ncbi:DUF6401 family natural product biosynthesis protein [Actinomadura viridis]|uniref:Uncharacterized protein n=1 Tax=Actinomadura viridis TaxID=58110 RepID=A0A931DQ63_9ACTN|nr:DUF6401 family natural product biosynthesis protein [Actinomadura viridis]MBG6091992.1 hypothetical protein [Actinomadura viridis]
MSEELGLLIRDIGEAGIAEMAGTPALVAAVDQHAAAVRDLIVGPGGYLPEPDALMTYLQGFAEDAFKRGWKPVNTQDWEFVRIVTVCWMMRQGGSPPV